MTRLHWILAFAFLATVGAAAAIFAYRDVAIWWRGRAAKRAQARTDRTERAAAQARLNDELAAKYIPRRGG